MYTRKLYEVYHILEGLVELLFSSKERHRRLRRDHSYMLNCVQCIQKSHIENPIFLLKNTTLPCKYGVGSNIVSQKMQVSG